MQIFQNLLWLPLNQLIYQYCNVIVFLDAYIITHNFDSLRKLYPITRKFYISSQSAYADKYCRSCMPTIEHESRKLLLIFYLPLKVLIGEIARAFTTSSSPFRTPEIMDQSARIILIAAPQFIYHVSGTRGTNYVRLYLQVLNTSKSINYACIYILNTNHFKKSYYILCALQICPFSCRGGRESSLRKSNFDVTYLVFIS